MSVSNRRMRVHALAAATAVAFSAFAAPAFAGKLNLSGLEAGAQYDRFIVKYRDGSAEHAGAAKVQRPHSMPRPARRRRQALGVSHVRRIADGRRRGPRRSQARPRRSRNADAPDRRRPERRVRRSRQAQQAAADAERHQLQRSSGATPAPTASSANQAWDVTNGSGAVVAVLDTGITNHSDLNANILPGYDFIIDTAVSNDGNGRDSDAERSGRLGHRQPVRRYARRRRTPAGTAPTSPAPIAAVTNNAKGVAGVAYGAKIVPVRVLGTCGGYDSDIADAIIWASGGTVSGVPANANPAEVINLSLGGSGACGTTTQNAINGAVGRGTTLVIAAGNDNVNVSNASPANCNNVIAVASITSTGARSSFSNYGTLIDIAAPGSNILSTLNAGTTTPGAETYASYNGTSMATPHVAGVVALIQSVATTPKTPAQVEALIKGNVTAFPSTPSQPIGPGILNAKAVVDATNGTTPPPAAAR